MQRVQKQRVYYLVDVFNTGVVHAAAAARCGVQGAFEHGAKDCGADFAPVKVFAGLQQKQLLDLVRKLGDFYVLVGKQAAVDVGEGSQLVVQVGVALGGRFVQHLKKVNQRAAQILGGIRLQIIVKHVLAPKDPRVLGIKAEHQPHAQHIQALQAARVGGILVLRQQRVVQPAHDGAGRYGNLHLLLDVLVFAVHQKLQAVIIPFQILKINNLWLAKGLFHIINIKLRKVARHNPARTLRIGQLGRIALGLLEGGQQAAVRLLDRLVQIFIQALLLNQHVGAGDDAVNKAGVVQHNLVFKADKLRWVLHLQHLAQKLQPKGLAFTLFVALACPVLDKLLHSQALLLLRCRHLYHSVSRKYSYIIAYLQKNIVIIRLRQALWAGS